MFDFSSDKEFGSKTELLNSNNFYRTRGKRIFDICFAIALILAVVPIIAVLYVLVRLDGGPAFFGHKRVGKSGKVFVCLKLRTMVPNAEAILQAYLENNFQARLEWDSNFKLDHDPRITRLGRFLRKSSLDELPQFFNVLLGDMSIVGPRPVTSVELEKYGDAKESYLACKPGVTGVWQVFGRNDTSYNERVNLDNAYYQNMAISLDLKLILLTPLVMLKMCGR